MLNWYSGQVLLNYSEHADLGWSCSNIAALGHQQAWIPISLNEMAEASAYLPIAILRYQQRWYIVGVANDIYLSNTQISDLAQLNHKFVPQCIQLYPFCLMPPDCSQVSSKDGVQLGIDWRCLVPLKEKGTMPLFDKNRQFSSVVMNRLYLLYRLKIGLFDAECGIHALS